MLIATLIYGLYEDHNINIKNDVYLVTSIDNDYNKILNLYKPINYKFLPKLYFPFIRNNYYLKTVIKLCLDSNIKYDYVIINRFNNFVNISKNIDLNKIFIINKYNFFIPYKYLKELYNLINLSYSNKKLINKIKKKFN